MDEEKIVRSRRNLSICLLVFAASIFTVSWVIANLYFKAAVYECHYGVDDSNFLGLQGHVSKNSVWVNGGYDRLDDIRCKPDPKAEDFVCSEGSTKFLGYEYATKKDFSKAGFV